MVSFIPGETQVIDVLDGDFDPLGNALSGDTPGLALAIAAGFEPQQGMATVNPDGTITYTAAGDASGTDSFRYQVTLAEGGSTTAEVAISFGTAADDVIAVTTFADTVNAEDGITSLREAVIEANGRDRPTTILLEAGTYTLTRIDESSLIFSVPDTPAVNDLDILGDITITGPGAAGSGTETSVEYGFVIDPDLRERTNFSDLNSARAVSDVPDQNADTGISVHADARLVLENVNVSGALGESRTSALENLGGTVEIRTASFTNNVSEGSVATDQFATDAIGKQGVTEFFDTSRGGAILNTDGVLMIEDTLFEGNAAAMGGAIAVSGGEARIANSVFVDNTSYESNVTLRDVGSKNIVGEVGEPLKISFGWDRASFEPGQGAAIYNDGGIVTLEDSTEVQGSRFEPLVPLSKVVRGSFVPIDGLTGVVTGPPETLSLFGSTRYPNDTFPDFDYAVIASEPGGALFIDPSVELDVPSNPNVPDLVLGSAGAPALAIRVAAVAATSPASDPAVMVAAGVDVTTIGLGAEEILDPDAILVTPIEISLPLFGGTLRIFGPGFVTPADLGAFIRSAPALDETLAAIDGAVTEIRLDDAMGSPLISAVGLSLDLDGLVSDLAEALEEGDSFDSALDLLGDQPLPVTGTEDAETLAGGDGDDTLTGLGGDDTYVIGPNAGQDLIVEAPGGGSDKLILVGIARAEVTQETDGGITRLFGPDGVSLVAIEGDGSAVETIVFRTDDGDEALAIAGIPQLSEAPPADVPGAPRPRGPQARDDTAVISEDAESLLIDVLSNDLLGGAVLAELDAGETTGRFSLAPDGRSVLYETTAALQTLASGETFAERAEYTIAGPAGTSTASIMVTVEGANDDPVAVDISRQVSAERGLFIAPLIMDPDGDQPTIIGLDASEIDGVAEIVDRDLVFYDPRDAFSDLAPGEQRIERLELLISDGFGGRETAAVTIRVTSPEVTETIQGTAAADSLVVPSLAVARVIDGAAGEDRLSLPVRSSDYVLRPEEGGHSLWPLSDLGSSAGQMVRDVEALDFDDGSLSLVADPALEVIELLYALTYDRPSDLPGRSFWYSAHRDGLALDRIAGAFAEAPEFLAVYGDSASDAAVVTQFYDRGLGRSADPGGQAFWTEQLQSGRFGLEDLLLAFAQSDEIRWRYNDLVDDGSYLFV